MRLIDADDLIKILSKNSIFTKITNAEDKNVIEIINEQPTAYNVEKVIADVDDFGDSCYQCQEDCRTKGCLVERIKNVIRNGGKE